MWSGIVSRRTKLFQAETGKQGLGAAFGILLACCGTAVAADLPGTPPLAPAAPPAYDFWTSPYLFGDWNGTRTALKDKGFDFQFGYIVEGVTNLSGGNRRMADQAGQLQVGSTIDLGQVIGDKGGQFQITFTERNGRNLATDAGLGTLQQVNEIYGRDDIVRLTQFWFDQKFANDVLDLKIGRLTMDEDFNTLSCDFVNFNFCGGQPGNIDANYVFYWPLSQWGTRLKATIANFGYVEIGVYDDNPNYQNANPAIALAPTFPSGSTGAMVPVEIAWTPSFGPLAGTYKLGAWYDTSAAPDVYTSVNGQPIAISGLNPLRDSGRYGGYFSVMQQLTAGPAGSDPKHGLFAFFNATFSDERTSVQDRQINGGLEFHGPFPSRLNDDVGIALGTTHINARVAAAQALANALGAGPGFTQTGELASEVFYAYQLTPAVNLRGSVQYVHNPGGYNDSGTYQDTLVLGVRATLTF